MGWRLGADCAGVGIGAAGYEPSRSFDIYSNHVP